MSFELATSSLVTAIRAAELAWVGPPALVVQYENKNTVDLSTRKDPYIDAQVLFQDGRQLSIGAATRQVGNYGQVHLIVHTVQGSGYLAQRKVIDHFVPYLELKDFAVARTSAAHVAPCYPQRGWELLPLIIPFWFQRLVVPA